MQKKHFTIPIFIPEMACPFRCIYCDQHKISGIKTIPSPNDVKAIIEKNLSTISKDNSEIEIGFFGGSFTGIPINDQQAYLKIAQPYIEQGIVNSIRLSTRPDYISIDILHFLQKFNVKIIELGAQSLDDEVLLLSKRGHTEADVKKASHLIKSHGFKLGLQMMIGLPGDTLEKTIATANKIVELSADNTRIYPCIVIKDTYLEELYIKGKYKALTIDESIDAMKNIIPIFEKANVNIIRIGLHPSKDLQGAAFVAGPYHSSLRELVETKLWEDKLKVYTENSENHQNITIFVSKKMYNPAIGYHAANRKTLEKKYRKVKFSIDYNLINREFYVHNH
ncbi:MAG: radical SAM protein [Bacteroidetes bacterium]|nr:radical SAM protein [Bacteroidota bacterium]